MKLIAVVGVIACLHSAVITHAQTVTLSERNAPLETVLEEIKKQTGYTYFLDDNLLQKAHKVTVTLKDVPLRDALDSCFARQPLDYLVIGKTITIKLKEQAVAATKISTRRTVTGKVTSSDGNPLEGASVRIKATLRGVNTDSNGEFALKDVEENMMLEISHIGYSPQLFFPPKDKPIIVCLKPESRSLDEVIATGYRTTTKRFMLATVTEISGKTIENQPVNDVLAALQGRVPVMMITQRSGLPGSAFIVQIRGQRSIGTKPGNLPVNSPLFIVDGVPFLSSSVSVAQLQGVTPSTPFSTINPEDIESITILKDANSTSIYGSMGANGVVLITTRKPKPGKTTVDVNMYMGEGRITKEADFMDTRQYFAMRREAIANDHETPQDSNPFGPGYAPDIKSWDTTRYTNWKKLLIEGPAHIADAHVRLAGGNAHTQFSLSTGYNRETTVFPGDFHKSLSSVMLNVNHTSLSNKFGIAIATSYSSDNNKLISRDLTNYINTAPNAPVYDAQGHITFRENNIPYQNPLAFVLQTYDLLMERLTGSVNINYKILPLLNFKTLAGYTILSGDETRKIPIASQDPVTSPTGIANFGNSKDRMWIIEPQLEFATSKLKGNKLRAMIGSTLREQIAKADVVNGEGYTSDASLGSIAGADSIYSTNDYMQYRLESLYGLVNYNIRDRYIFEATGRFDGSSRFAPDKRFGGFGSLAAGWIFTNEGFIQKKFPFLSFGKLRASWGTSGNDQIDDYTYLDTWTNTINSYQGPGLVPSRLYNRNLQWELEKNFDIGLNIGFLHNKLLIDAVWNQSRTGNELIGYSLPTQTGFNTIARNSDAVVQNRNFELEINAKIIDRPDIKWSTSFNISFQRNKLIKFPGLDSSSYRFNYIIGSPLNLQWKYRTSGIDPVTGVYQILDHNNKPIQFPDDNKDLFPGGTYNPSYFGGLQSNIQYHNWELDFLFQFIKQRGRDFFYSIGLAPGYQFINSPVDVLNRWQKPGDNVPYEKFTQDPSSPAYIAAYYHANSEASFTDASFIRLKNVSLSYYLPEKWMRQVKMNSCRLYLQAQNLLTITPYKGPDPENGSINPMGLPPLRVITFGIRASF